MASRRIALAMRPLFAQQRIAVSRFSTSCAVRADHVSEFRGKINTLVRDYENFNGLNTTGGSSELADRVEFGEEHKSPELDRLRVVPKDRSFYMANPPHEEILRELNEMLQMHINIPTIPKEQVDNKTTWLSSEEYKSMLGGEHFKPKYYKSLLKLLNRLSVIDPQLMPAQVRDSLQPFTKRVSDNWADKKYPVLDSIGRAIAVGRRKSSSARVQLVKSNEHASGQILVNNKPLDAYFARHSDRVNVMYPLQVCGVESGYNAFVTVTGGGTSGQSAAVAHSISRALVIHNPLFLTRLSRANCLQRDPRVKERKKPGKPKARKSYTWVKR